MKKTIAISIGALLLLSTAALAQEEKVLNVYNWSDYCLLYTSDAADE